MRFVAHAAVWLAGCLFHCVLPSPALPVPSLPAAGRAPAAPQPRTAASPAQAQRAAAAPPSTPPTAAAAVPRVGAQTPTSSVTHTEQVARLQGMVHSLTDDLHTSSSRCQELAQVCARMACMCVRDGGQKELQQAGRANSCMSWAGTQAAARRGDGPPACHSFTHQCSKWWRPPPTRFAA